MTCTLVEGYPAGQCSVSGPELLPEGSLDTPSSDGRYAAARGPEAVSLHGTASSPANPEEAPCAVNAFAAQSLSKSTASG